MRRWLLRPVGAGSSGRLECPHLLSYLLALVLVDEDEGERLGRQVAPAHEPLVALFDEQGASEADHRWVVGEDPDDV